MGNFHLKVEITFTSEYKLRLFIKRDKGFFNKLNYDIMKWVTTVYKKVYIEITNACNLSCDFCIQN